MKTITCILLAALISIGTGTLRADAGYNFGITKVATKLAGETSRKEGVNLAKEDWAYKVTIENKSFKDLDNVEIKYIIFMQPKMADKGSLKKAPLVRNVGEQKLASLKNFEKFTFETSVVTRTSVQLQPGYVWTSGSGNRGARDLLSGLWVRIFVNGQQVMESVEPPSIKTAEAWEKQ